MKEALGIIRWRRVQLLQGWGARGAKNDQRTGRKLSLSVCVDLLIACAKKGDLSLIQLPDAKIKEANNSSKEQSHPFILVSRFITLPWKELHIHIGCFTTESICLPNLFSPLAKVQISIFGLLNLHFKWPQSSMLLLMLLFVTFIYFQLS